MQSLFLLLVLLANPPLHRRSHRNAIDPLQQMREGLHILLLGESRELIALDPRPRADISDGVLPPTIAC